MLGAGLDAVFKPRSIAIIGASQDETKIGGRPVYFLRKYGFAGKIYPVNPRSSEVQGLLAYPSVTALPEVPDLAIIAVAAEAVPRAVAECAARGVRAAVVLSSGFGEMGAAGEALQDELRATVATTGIRLLGPNCLGSIGITDKAIATFSIVIENSLPPAGPLGIVSQSGNLGSYTMLLAFERSVGISRFITTGNECDIDVADAVAWMARDPETKVILLCVETCRNAPRLVQALEEARSVAKPVIVLKIGVSDAGQAAAASHTGALAGSDAVFDAVLKRTGAIRVHSLEHLIEVGHAATLLAPNRLPAGNRVAIVTASGGFGVLLADAATAAGLTIPAMTAVTQKRVLDLVPYASPRNPVDATAQISSRPELLERILAAVAEDPGTDSVVFMISSALQVPRLRSVFMQALTNLKKTYPDRVVMLCTHGAPDAVAALNALGYPTVDGVDAACRTLAALAAMGRNSTAVSPTVTVTKGAVLAADTFRHEAGAKYALAAAGLPVLPEHVIHTPAEAVTAAEKLGYPVVLKIVSEDLPHKTEVGGVAIGLTDREQVSRGCAELLARVKAKAPNARIDGVLVAPMVMGGTELILGIKRDPIFGPAVVVGLGGIFAEILKDVCVRPAPVDEAEAMDMLRSLKAFAILDGARGRARADLAAAARAITSLSIFAVAHADQVAEVDINPLVVLPEGQGAYALDALIVPLTPKA
jgi:acetate---CoA ligase (ADP-forming)